MLIPRQMKREQKTLLDLFARLEKPEQKTLLDFAEFLVARGNTASPAAEQVLAQPLATPRPEEESVVAAIKRLSATYFMLDRPELLNESSTLMTQHIMQGRAADEVIDELEALFQRFYQELIAGHAGGEE